MLGGLRGEIRYWRGVLWRHLRARTYGHRPTSAYTAHFCAVFHERVVGSEACRGVTWNGGRYEGQLVGDNTGHVPGWALSPRPARTVAAPSCNAASRRTPSS